MDLLRRCFKRISDTFWSPDIWLPPGNDWDSVKLSCPGFPEFSDLVLPIYYSFIIILVRALFEWLIARPLGRFCGLKDSGSQLPHLFQCIVHRFRAFVHMASGHIYCDANESETPDPIIRLIHHKTVLDKFAEVCWRAVFYEGIFLYGLYALWDKPWFWDTTHCWYGYPYQPVDPEIRWYYLIELSFYWALMFSQFVDVVRKDFWVNFIHHITTILLLSFSWADNFVRIGTLVLVIHDAADFWMETAKMARYCKKNRLCNVLFVIFTAVWCVTRCGIYPFKYKLFLQAILQIVNCFRILYSTLLEAPAIIVFFPAYYIFNSLLLVLFVLQLFWTTLIIRIALNAVRSGETDDVRSDDEDNEEEKLKDDENASTASEFDFQEKVKLS
ncbi:Ceramide synthase 6 [Trichinella britovi]|uniref:Ceramide synthase 6 n=3 Tax=Trichinella TaxID=6333 RepID=A0A0V1CAH7_TRIBR|nr:Ceramide synthase 6 [Trichinella murrelli]KRY18529.1 Ceramide synthase 6 [Trichinella patagoniensis]KRY46261.1 Ceramide synthase 6 [Trichinella britovi]KRZ83015.1 Ceramide synthase 6 [Trichinella sp. T8]